MASVWYLMRSKRDGQYLAAYPDLPVGQARSPEHGYLLIFREHADALSYMGRHAKDMQGDVGVESVMANQLKATLNRWNFKGVGVVEDPWLPRIQFGQTA
jgi:hypothetical protein